MPKAERLPEKMNSWPKSESFSSGHYLPIYPPAGKGFIYFITLRIISQGERMQIVPVYLVDFPCFFVRNYQPCRFFVSPSLASARSQCSFVFYDRLKV